MAVATEADDSYLGAVMETRAKSSQFDWAAYAREQRALHPVAWEALRPRNIAAVRQQVPVMAASQPMAVARMMFQIYNTEIIPLIGAQRRNPSPSVWAWVERLMAITVARLKTEGSIIDYRTQVWANRRQGPTTRRDIHPADPRENEASFERSIERLPGTPVRPSPPAYDWILSRRQPR